MKCKQVKKNLLLLLDDELNEKKQRIVQKHLDECASCRTQLSVLADLYEGMARAETPKPNPFLWTRISAAVTEIASARTPFYTVIARLPKLASTVGLVLLFAGGVGAGIFLGSTPQMLTASTAAESQTQKEQYVHASGLDTFDDLTPQSISRIYAVFTIKPE